MSTTSSSCRGLLLPAALLVSSCSGEGAGGLAGGAVETIGIDAVQDVGTAEAIANIADAIEAEDGTIWVLNSSEPYFVAMTPDGLVERTWGRRGGGPGEFRNPNVLVENSAGVWVYDQGRHGLLRIDGPEDPVETIDVSRDSLPPARIASTENAGTGSGARLWIHGTPSGLLFARGKQGSTAHVRLWSAELVRLRPDGVIDVVFSIDENVGDPASRYGAQATEFLPYPLWASCPDQSFALYDPLSNSIRRFSAGGAMSDSIALPPERAVEINMDRIFRMAFEFVRNQAPAGQRPDSATMYAQLESQWAQMEASASPTFPEYADLHCTEGNVLWLQQFDADAGEMGRGRLWMRIAPQNDARTYRFPDAFRPLRFQPNRALGIHRGEFDIESVAWLNLPSPS